ncbi:MAG: InlB B-repeat-containing protein [Bacillus subtilis]|nr:InlB B-repeat-containing protein [Bacillus subtilis]
MTKYGITDAIGTADLTTFIGYAFATRSSGQCSSGTIIGTGGLTLKVYYTRNTNTSYAIQYYHQDIIGVGFTLVETVDLTGTTGASVSALTKSYDGFTFDVDHPSNHLVGTIMADGTLVLDVYYTRNEFTIELDSQGGTPTNALKVRAIKARLARPTPTKEGYTFQGWIDETNVAYTSTSTVEGSLTLYASWRIKSFTVTITRTMLASNGITVLSTEVVNRTVSYGMTYSPITAIEGYAFVNVIHNAVSFTNSDFAMATYSKHRFRGRLQTQNRYCDVLSKSFGRRCDDANYRRLQRFDWFVADFDAKTRLHCCLG